MPPSGLVNGDGEPREPCERLCFEPGSSHFDT